MASRTLTVETCGTPIVGLWCHRCLLPSGVGMVLLVAGKPLTHVRCRDCNTRL
jgi:hypothetical protein